MICAVAALILQAPSRPFFDESKSLLPTQEWNREIVAKQAGKIRFRVDTVGPFALTVMNDKAHRGVLSNNMQGISKKDIMLTQDFSGPSSEGTVKLGKGTSWFLIENSASSTATLRLRCWAVK